MIGPQHLCLQDAIVKIAVILLKSFLNSVMRLKTGHSFTLNISGFISVQHKTYQLNVD